MSCSCNHCYSTPCCCPQPVAQSTTTTTTCNGTPCDVAFTSDCIVYEGPDLDCYGIKKGDSVTEIIELILAQLAPCNPTTTTTSTSTSTTTSTSTSSTTSTTTEEPSTTTTSSSTTTTSSTSSTTTTTTAEPTTTTSSSTSTTSSTSSTTSTTTIDDRTTSTTTTTTTEGPTPPEQKILFLAGDMTGTQEQGDQTSSRVWIYDVGGDTYQLLSVTNIIDGTDIAHTLNKMWIMKNDGAGNTLIREWDLNISTLSANNEIDYVITGTDFGKGLCAINDTKLVSIENGTGNVYEITLSASPTPTASLSLKFSTGAATSLYGDLIVTPTHLIAGIEDGGQRYLRQYTYPAGVLQINVPLPGNTLVNYTWGMFENLAELYFTTCQDWTISQVSLVSPYDLVSPSTPYTAGTVGWIVGASSEPSQNNVILVP